MIDSPVTATLPFDRDGAHHGHLRLPYSRDDSAWGHVMIPITVLRNGAGPTALMTGGTHGDEYEGPMALMALATEIDPARISGRVILIPALNHPAFRAGTRTSPIDRGNLNRSFPGRPDGSITERIADYVTRGLLPMADLVLDFHSGGKTLDFLPFAASHVLADAEQQARCRAAALAFGAPYTMLMEEIDARGMYDTTAEAMGKVFVSTELGGGGTATARSVGIARQGALNLLAHAGILPGPLSPPPTVMLDMQGDGTFTFAEGAGLAEPMADLGDTIRAGQPLVRVWPVESSGAAARVYHAGRDGLLAGRHFPGLVGAGDCLAVVAGRVG